ncbi:MAG: hypothetical protein Q7R69_00445 [bacterium]|nr:hypothetical protein [bacterium]
MSQDEMSEDAIEDDDFDQDNPKNLCWAIMVNPVKRSWYICSIEKGAEVGERPDLCGYDENDIVGAFFDQETDAFLVALIELGGDSVELGGKIESVLSFV